MTDVLSVPDCHFQLAFAVSSADFTAPFMELRSTPETSSFPACVSRRAATSSRGDERRRKKLAYFSSLMNGAGVRPLLRIHEVLPVEKNIHGHSNGRKSEPSTSSSRFSFIFAERMMMDDDDYATG
jgi:hypothetical protein